MTWVAPGGSNAPSRGGTASPLIVRSLANFASAAPLCLESADCFEVLPFLLMPITSHPHNRRQSNGDGDETVRFAPRGSGFYA